MIYFNNSGFWLFILVFSFFFFFFFCCFYCCLLGLIFFSRLSPLKCVAPDIRFFVLVFIFKPGVTLGLHSLVLHWRLARSCTHIPWSSKAFTLCWWIYVWAGLNMQASGYFQVCLSFYFILNCLTSPCVASVSQQCVSGLHPLWFMLCMCISSS